MVDTSRRTLEPQLVSPFPAPVARMLAELNDADPARVLPIVLEALSAVCGAVGVRVSFSDVEERSLVVWDAAGAALTSRTHRMDVEGSIHGKVYRSGRTERAEVDLLPAILTPVMARSERLGVLEVVFDAPPQEWAEAVVASAGLLLGYVVVVGDRWSDEFQVARRRQDMNLAAEVQWVSLPLAAFKTDRISLAGALEPAYEIAGDLYEYSCGREELVAGVFDAMGHGITAARLSDLAVAAHRNARRNGRDLSGQAGFIHDTLVGTFGKEGFVTGQLVTIDLGDPGRSRLVNAGHPAPFLHRKGGRPRQLRPEIDLPFGMPFEGGYRIQPLELASGDRLTLFSDGVVEARPDGGALFSEARLARCLRETRKLSPREAARNIIASVREHRAADLADDATMLIMDVL